MSRNCARASINRTLFFIILSASALACARAVSAQGVRPIRSPATAASGQPNLSVGPGGRVYLSWIDRLEQKRFALRFSVLEASGWSAPRTVAEGDNWFINWADFPSLIALSDGSLAAHWLARNGSGPYAYDVRVARSFDGGRTWGAPTTPHRDGTQTEHGFVSMFDAGRGRLGIVWLDGREMKGGHDGAGEGHAAGRMTLRHATLGRDGAPDSESVVDAQVCECCQTSAAPTSEGLIVVYRDRSDAEIRDIYAARLGKGGRWGEPRAVHADGWKIDGCPVNGPSVAARGRDVAVAWFTMAGGSPRVRVAFSKDAGATFGPAVEVGEGDPVGRVDVLMLGDASALVTWIEKTKDGAEVRARRVRADGQTDASVTVAPSGAARSSGFPHSALAGGRVVFAWTSPQGVQTAEMPAPTRGRQKR